MIGRFQGKSQVTNPAWRDKLDGAVAAIDAARRALRDALHLDAMLMNRRPFDRRMFDEFDDEFRGDRGLAAEVDRSRQQAIDLVNQVLVDAGTQPLGPVGRSRG